MYSKVDYIIYPAQWQVKTNKNTSANKLKCSVIYESRKCPTKRL